jgi:hypothetical protein
LIDQEILACFSSSRDKDRDTDNFYHPLRLLVIELYNNQTTPRAIQKSNHEVTNFGACAVYDLKEAWLDFELLN